ncbi:MAG: Ribosomal RNA small subunit methyltransferase A [Paraeggerthella hongkongensis]|uniref:16S rRNA (adenine(1518)-N(6)/adenine(1519)-N(6))- dimethyltransferase RsmA n=1 Tax=Paraeggerthella TaxID=651554 RepID=UPI001C109668|nr:MULTISPECIES: 16S rRNA (adenine(1518)-N(6)/adenine(1519)-N(6))-dimethyltransferase RsmA [Paraeggerthella]MBU5405184.1 16S rRNA (adenine(1518)-N(6)/adenine(1519)-N(6))-dimethyltransferase RsmA [Paraeggerthella hongkongensis]MCD2433447.1 16S rRNA (adenine(1518)-N(6)/adenine(1519)-N(6))-dimethyltransferase RsmA [Paraeggerthella hominis]MDY3981298.1 16S rRNA (adenine(1518)-N(6)/adenine(1519)-N(6))-dimethyltransferase RsmA [Paraeggerthella sp.]
MTKLSPLASVAETRAVLEAHGLTTKYSLGQNFLINDAILQKIVALSQVSESDDVLEVGPGIGTLTIALLKHAGRVASVERDADLPAVLAETLAPWADRFTLISKDALDLRTEDLPFSPTKLVANLPYAVAATVVLDYFEGFASLESATVMVQKEVADRMAAQPGTKTYGAYTVKLRLYAEPAGRFAVGPGNFFPPPRVESAVLRLDRRPVFDEAGDPLDAAALKAAAVMADASFATRRKTIANSCKTYFGGRGAEGARVIERLPELLDHAGIDPKRRGETLDLPEFIKLGAALQQIV